MLTSLNALRERVLAGLERNAQAAARLLDTRPSRREILQTMARARHPTNGRENNATHERREHR